MWGLRSFVVRGGCLPKKNAPKAFFSCVCQNFSVPLQPQIMFYSMRRLFLYLFLALFAGFIVWCGYHDKSHNSITWTKNRPYLYTSIFYNADSLYYYIDIAFHEDDVYALTVAGTAAYNVRVFDPASRDSLPAVELEDADMMLWRAADLHYAPAVAVIRYLAQLGLWHHTIPWCLGYSSGCNYWNR